MTTQFTFAKVPLWNDLAFYIDGNSKITWDNGTYLNPRPNAFSLPHIATCPGSTERCRTSCYVHGLKKAAPEVYRHYELNNMALHAALMTRERADMAAALLAIWIRENAPGGFRWHVSGDVTSFRHAAWIADVCRLAPKVQFWIYTRTLDAVPALLAPNLTLNVSADRDNYARAYTAATQWSGVRLCYLVSAPDEVIPALPPGSVIFPDYPLRGRTLETPTEAPWWVALTNEQRRQVCPADFFGQSEEHRCGPCKKCLRPVGVGA
jgi:hypothetical protein